MALSVLTVAAQATPETLAVSSGSFAELSQAIQTANGNPGSTINVAPGEYSDGTSELPAITANVTIELDPSFSTPNVTTDGINAANRVILDSPPTADKGILTLAGSINVTIDGIEFTGAAIDSTLGGNGAGIRDQITGPGSLTIKNSIFYNNQDGILADSDSQEAISIANSLFAGNGVDAGGFTCSPDCDHAAYINAVSSLDVTGSVFCGTIVGHDIKSRAAVTTITGNTLYDGATASVPGCTAGSTSYSIDLPNGGQATIDGNTIIQGSATQNPIMVEFGEEGGLLPSNSLLVENNLFDNSNGPGDAIGVNDTICSVAKVQNVANTFVTVPTPISPAGCEIDSGGGGGGTPVPEPGSLWLLAVALVISLAAALARAAAGPTRLAAKVA